MELLATLSGASFSIDAAPFDSGGTSPRIGVFVLAIDPSIFAGSVERLAGQFGSFRDEHGVRLPAVEMTSVGDSVEIDPKVLQRLQEAARG